MNIQQAAAGENLVELIFLQLIHASAAGYDHGLDVEIIERIGDAMEQHPVVGGDFQTLVMVARGGLRITAAAVLKEPGKIYQS